MNKREVLLKRIQVCDFALNDAALYLDTHPDDIKALEYFKKYNSIRKEASCEYIENYGPLTHADYDGGDSWKWVESPWPWQTAQEVELNVDL